VSTARKLRGPQDLVIVPAGRYKALKKLAETATSEIFLAEHVGVSGLRRLHVLKRLRPSLSAEASFRVALAETVREAMALHHGNLVGVLDAGDANGRPFLVLELVEGWSLEQLTWRARTAQHALPWPLAVFIAVEVSRALAFLHRPSHGLMREGIVHGDVSPSSVLISEQGEVKLADWCVAHARARHSGNAMTAAKAAFASPELAVAEPADARSDIFSLGSLLYWLLADVPPFKGNGEREVLGRVEAVDCAPLDKVREGLPKELYKVVRIAMQRDPAHRYQTTLDVRAALESVASRERCGRSELDGWLASLARRDGRGPAAGEVRPNIVVPLRALKTDAKKGSDPIFGRAATTLTALTTGSRRLSPFPRRKVLLAAVGMVVLGFCLEKLWHRATAAVPAAVPVEAPAPTPPPAAKVLPTGTKSAQADPDVTLDGEVVEASPDPGQIQLHASVDSVSDDRAYVHVETTPPGAAVVLDDRTLGTTPVSLRFKVGVPFALQFQLDGYRPETRWLTVHGADDVTLALPPVSAR
jgi:serine/threonine protein kinase